MMRWSFAIDRSVVLLPHRTALRCLRWYVRYAPGSLAKSFLVRTLLDQGLRRYPCSCATRTRFGATLTVTTSDFIQRYLYLFGMWEPYLSRWMQSRLQPGDVFIDVGANIGYFALIASSLVGPTGEVVAIEASPQFHKALASNVRANACTNVRTVNTAVSDAAGRLTFYLEDSGNLGATTIVRPHGPVESSFAMDAQPLPEILTPQELTRARLIKIDVEGTEGAVVRGLAPVLDRLRPDVELVIEVNPRRLAEQGQSVDDVLEPLRAHGFRVYRLTNDYKAASYPSAMYRRAAVPIRWWGPITEQSDLVFSHVNAEDLS